MSKVTCNFSHLQKIVFLVTDVNVLALHQPLENLRHKKLSVAQDLRIRHQNKRTFNSPYHSPVGVYLIKQIAITIGINFQAFRFLCNIPTRHSVNINNHSATCTLRSGEQCHQFWRHPSYSFTWNHVYYVYGLPLAMYDETRSDMRN